MGHDWPTLPTFTSFEEGFDMAPQDRNVHKDAYLMRKELAVPIVTPTGTDEDEIQFWFKPRHNFRLTDLYAYAAVVATTLSTVRAAISGVGLR